MFVMNRNCVLHEVLCFLDYNHAKLWKTKSTIISKFILHLGGYELSNIDVRIDFLTWGSTHSSSCSSNRKPSPISPPEKWAGPRFREPD